MSRLIATATLLRGAGALAWLGYTWALARLLPPDDLGIMLTVLSLAGLCAGLLTAGWAQLILRDGARAQAAGAPGQLTSLITQAVKALTLRGFLMMLGLGALFGLLEASSLPRDPVSLTLAALTPVLMALLGLFASARRAQGALVPALASQSLLRALIPLALSAALAQTMPLTLQAALWVYAMGVGLCLPVAWPRPAPPLPYRPNPASLRALSAAQAGWMLLSHLDVIVLALVLSPREAALYLVARRLAGLLALLFDALRSALAPALSIAFANGAGFGGLAARTNLGFFLIGGGAGTALAVLGPFALLLFGAEFAQVTPILIWLTLGQAAPALFGATGMLMTMTDMERDRALLIWIAIPGAAAALWLAAQNGPHVLAIATAVAQLAFTAACAFRLAQRFGILPGLTALLYPSLRLKS